MTDQQFNELKEMVYQFARIIQADALIDAKYDKHKSIDVLYDALASLNDLRGDQEMKKPIDSGESNGL